jgi:RNA polymerase sigma-70 factor (ECF subfamily)
VTSDRAYQIDRELVARLFRQANAERWSLPLDTFAAALEASAARAGSGGAVRRHLEGLHLEDLALACACAAGSDAAWEHFVRELRPSLYRAADALDASGGARELADSLYADLFGLSERDGVRRSLFIYFHGRSSLATWLRAVLAQRFVDRVRARRRTVPLPEDPAPVLEARSRPSDPDRPRWIALLRHALTHAIASLADRDRLRLSSYYVQDMTLAQIGRLLGEHEATVSRHLTRTRRLIREDVERRLREQAGLRDDEIGACFESVLEDAGPLDLGRLLASAGRKQPDADRSNQESHADER